MKNAASSLLGAAMLICGAGLFVYGILDFSPPAGRGLFSGYSYSLEPRLQAAIGAALAVAGWLLRSSPR